MVLATANSSLEPKMIRNKRFQFEYILGWPFITPDPWVLGGWRFLRIYVLVLEIGVNLRFGTFGEAILSSVVGVSEIMTVACWHKGESEWVVRR